VKDLLKKKFTRKNTTRVQSLRNSVKDNTIKTKVDDNVKDIIGEADVNEEKATIEIEKENEKKNEN